MASQFLVVDVGGTKILAAAMERDGTIVARHKLKTDRKSREGLLEQLDEALDAVLDAAKWSKSDVAGLCLGVPGVVDSRRGAVVFTPNAPLTDTPLRDLLAAKWSCPILVGNDVNIGMKGEVTRGAAQGAPSALGIFVGTGIGGALFLNGQLVEGARGLGGEIGHTLVPIGADEEGREPIKKVVHLETLCSRTAIENQLRHAIVKEGKKSALTEILGDKKLERIRSGALKDALKKGDPLVTEVVRRACHLLGLATASAVHLVDPEIIVLGGGVIEACGKWMVPWIEKSAQKVTLSGTGAPLKIVPSALGDDALLMGGLAMLLENDGASSLNPAVLASVDKPLERG